MDKRIIPLFSLVTQLTVLLAMVLQLHGIIVTWMAFQNIAHNKITYNRGRKRSYYLRKLEKGRLKRLQRKKRTLWFRPGRTDSWWQKMLRGEAPEDSWKKNLRLTREEFYDLVEQLRPYVSTNFSSPNYRALPVEKKVAVTLYYLKDTGSLNMTANAFGLAVCTVSKVIFDICEAIAIFLGPKYISLPRNEDEMRAKVSEFETKFGMIQAFGCIDGTHVPIICPGVNSQDYYSYKGFYSLNVQAVCDYRGQFLDVECRWPGSVHDAKVFANSNVNKKLRNGTLPGTYRSVIPGCRSIPNYLIGDPAYPLLPFCLKEYDSCQNNEQVVFNNMLRSARNPIECAFGRLKARWRVLTRKMDLKITAVPTVVYACFVLHNFCEKNKRYVDEDLVQEQIRSAMNNSGDRDEASDPVYSVDSGEGVVVRDLLTKYVRFNLPDHIVS